MIRLPLPGYTPTYISLILSLLLIIGITPWLRSKTHEFDRAIATETKMISHHQSVLAQQASGTSPSLAIDDDLATAILAPIDRPQYSQNIDTIAHSLGMTETTSSFSSPTPQTISAPSGRPHNLNTTNVHFTARIHTTAVLDPFLTKLRAVTPGSFRITQFDLTREDATETSSLILSLRWTWLSSTGNP